MSKTFLIILSGKISNNLDEKLSIMNMIKKNRGVLKANILIKLEEIKTNDTRLSEVGVIYLMML